MSGPTTAIRKSAPGVRASLSSSDTPPNSQRVIRRTPIPFRLATTAWDTSWASNEAKNRAVATIPTIQ